MTSRRITLEQFEGTDVSPSHENADYKRGKADGLAHAETLLAAKTTQSVSEISSTLTDMSFGYEEARLHIIGQLRPLILQISELVLPQIAKESFSAHLLEVLEAEFNSTASNPIQISVAPELISTFDDIQHDARFVFISNADLVNGQALIEQSETSLLLDLPALIDALRTTLSAFERPERNQVHG